MYVDAGAKYQLRSAEAAQSVDYKAGRMLLGH